MSKNKLGETDLGETGQEPWRAWLRGVVGSHGGVTAVARLAEVPKQTLDNYLSGRTKKPNLDYLYRIAAACAVEMTWLKEDASTQVAVKGLAERELVPYEGLVSVPQKAPRNRRRWTVKTRALDLAGILPGDVLEFELGQEPQSGDLVVAQVLDDESGTSETVLCLFKPPFLMVHTNDPTIDIAPIPIEPNGERAKVIGAFVRLVREARR